jgi:hypothetical protein
VGALVLIGPACALSKPIAFANGTTVMAEYGAGTMWEAQIFYAPQYNYSVGGGHVEFDSDVRSETARVTYARLNYLLHLKTDLQKASAFSIRVDTLQLGIAPYKHEYNQIATWVLVQARQYTDDIHHGTEVAALLRFFRGGAWIEAGVTNGGKLQAMAMFNF